MDNITEDANVSTDDMVRQRAFDCMTAIDNAVLYRINGINRPFGYGVSVYYPPYKNKYKSDYEDISFAEMNLWAEYLSSYLDIESNDTDEPSVDTGADDNTIDPNNPNSVIACTATITSVNDFDVAGVNFVLGKVSGAEIQIIGNINLPIGAIDVSNPPNFTIEPEINWNGKWFVIGDGGSNYLFAPFKSFDFAGVDEDGNNIYYAQMSAVLLPAGETDWSTEASTITLVFSVVTSTNSGEWAGEFISAFELSDTGPTPVDIKTGDKIKPIYQIITGGDAIEVPSSNSITLGVQGLDLGLLPVPAGDYKIGYTAVDYSENWGEDYADITVQ